MTVATEVCILGAGLAGLSLADSLLEADISSVVIDKNSIAGGASGTPGGLVNPATGRRAKKSWEAEACYEAIAGNLSKVKSHTGGSFFQKTGLLRPALLEKMARKMKDQYERTSWPQGWCQWKKEEEIKEMHTGITCVDGGLWLPIGLSVDVGEYMTSFASYLSDLKVPIYFNQHPQIIKEPSQWKIELQQITITCKHLIFATGHYTGQSSYWEWLPLNLIKGQVARFKTQQEPLTFSHSISSLGYIANTGSSDTFVQGSTYEHDFQHIDPDREGEQYLRKRMRRTLPQLEQRAEVAERWAGVRTSTPDYKPILGRHPEMDNLHVFTGLGSKGLLYSKFLADHYVDHLSNNTPLFSEISIERI